VISAITSAGDLTLGHVLQAAGVSDAKDVIALRHTIRPNDAALQDRSEQGALEYTRRQGVEANILPKNPPSLWLVMIAEGERGARSRFFGAHENRGELRGERTNEFRGDRDQEG
jgi:hypothetical protein